LSWPEESSGRLGRRPGAWVVTVDGTPVLYVESGGRGIDVLTADADALLAAIEALAASVRAGETGRLQLERVNGRPILGTPLAETLRDRGFRPTPRGFALSAEHW